MSANHRASTKTPSPSAAELSRRARAGCGLLPAGARFPAPVRHRHTAFRGARRIDHWRKHRREHVVAPDDVPSAAHDSSEARHAERDALVRALVQLSPQRRRVVVLRYLLDLPERQVADELGLSLGAVKSAASRGLAHLRQILGERTPTTLTTKEER